MELHQILISYLPSKEIKARISNKQIRINNEPVISSKIDIDVDCIGGMNLGDFIYKNIDKIPNCFRCIDIKDFFGKEETNIEAVDFLRNYTLISLSKRDHIVLQSF